MAEIARKRDVVPGTILGHLAAAVEAGKHIDLRKFITTEQQAEIEAALAQHSGPAMSPVHQALGGRYEFGLLRLVQAVRNRKG